MIGADLTGVQREALVLWASAFFLVGCFCGAAGWAWLDYRALKRRQKAQGRYKLPCHAWLAVAPWVLVQPPWVVFLALVAVGALLILWMAVATMAAMQDRAAKEEGQAWESRNGKAESGNWPRPETAGLWGQRALPDSQQPFTGVDSL